MELYEIVKVLVVGVATFCLAASASACGFTTVGNGLTIGTTSYLAEVNRGAEIHNHGYKPTWKSAPAKDISEDKEWRK